MNQSITYLQMTAVDLAAKISVLKQFLLQNRELHADPNVHKLFMGASLLLEGVERDADLLAHRLDSLEV